MDAFRERIRQRDRDIQIREVDQLLLEIVKPGTSTLHCNLGSAYAECKGAPAQCDLILDHWADAAIRIPSLDGKGPLIPVIRPSSYFADDSEWSMPIAGQLRTYFATKLEGMIGYVKDADVPAGPLMRQIAYGHAMENYRTLTPTFGWIDFETHVLIGDVDEALSLILMDWFWEMLPRKFAGDKIVVTVSRNAFLATGTESGGLPEALTKSYDLVQHEGKPIFHEPIAFHEGTWRLLSDVLEK